MRKFLSDVWCVLRFDFKPLSHYVYPAWQPLAWLALICIVGGVFSPFEVSLLARVLFTLIATGLGMALQTLWVMSWQRYIRGKPVTGSLFPLIVILATPQLLIAALPALSLSENVLLLVLGGTALYSVVLGVIGLAEVLDEPGWRIVVVMLGFLPFFMLYTNLLIGLALHWGWIALPAVANAG